MLEINDIPEYYHLKKQAIKGHTDQFWSKPVEEIQYYGYNYKYISCNTDTTFQLFSVKNIPKSFPHNQSIRFFSLVFSKTFGLVYKSKQFISLSTVLLYELIKYISLE